MAAPDGICRICGVRDKLSWEHVPPKAAYNARPIILANDDQLFKPGHWDGKRGRKQQKGSGAYTLCERCNNTTGAWYGRDYVEWVHDALRILGQVPDGDEIAGQVRFRGRPLRFLKQVATMFFSVNDDQFARRHPDLVRFVLNRDAVGLPPEYRFDLVLVRPGPLTRSSGVFSRGNIETGEMVSGSEVAHWPFAFRFILSEQAGPRYGPIEGFARLHPDDVREVWVTTIVGDVATRFPTDYRSRARVDREIAQTAAAGAEDQD